MAVLSDANRRAVWADWMRRNAEAVGITKADLRTALNDIDQWVDDNASNFNQAISQPARGALTSAQKDRLLALVVTKRFEEGA